MSTPTCRSCHPALLHDESQIFCQKFPGHEGMHEAEVDGTAYQWSKENDVTPYLYSLENATEDPINPSHYKQGGIECIDTIKAALGEAGFKSFLAGQVLKYVWRFEHKNGVEDLQKAEWYLDRLIKENTIGS